MSQRAHALPGTSLGLPLSEANISNPKPHAVHEDGVGAHSNTGFGQNQNCLKNIWFI